MTANVNYDAARMHAREANRYVGDEPVAVSAPVNAQISAAYALLAVADQLQAIHDQLASVLNRSGVAS